MTLKFVKPGGDEIFHQGQDSGGKPISLERDRNDRQDGRIARPSSLSAAAC